MIPPCIQFQTKVLPGHWIELTSPELPEGCLATVIVVLADTASPKRQLSEILADYPCGQLFQTGDEVDAYLRAERDSWDK